MQPALTIEDEAVAQMCARFKKIHASYGKRCKLDLERILTRLFTDPTCTLAALGREAGITREMMRQKVELYVEPLLGKQSFQEWRDARLEHLREARIAAYRNTAPTTGLAGEIARLAQGSDCPITVVPIGDGQQHDLRKVMADGELGLIHRTTVPWISGRSNRAYARFETRLSSISEFKVVIFFADIPQHRKRVYKVPESRSSGMVPRTQKRCCEHSDSSGSSGPKKPRAHHGLRSRLASPPLGPEADARADSS